jgi:O-antigen ligase
MREQSPRSWLLGLGPANVQSLLNKKYLAAGLYSGPAADNGHAHGYLEYNFHNQYMQSLVESGIIGLLVFLLMLLLPLIQAIKQRNVQSALYALMFLCFACSESFLLREQGLVSFVLLSSLFCNFMPIVNRKHDSAIN